MVPGRQIFKWMNSVSHPGIRASLRLVCSGFACHGLHKDVKDWFPACPVCQWAKVHHHTQRPLEPFSVQARRFNHVHIDVIILPRTSAGKEFPSVLVLWTSRWHSCVHTVIYLTGLGATHCLQRPNTFEGIVDRATRAAPPVGARSCRESTMVHCDRSRARNAWNPGELHEARAHWCVHFGTPQATDVGT